MLVWGAMAALAAGVTGYVGLRFLASRMGEGEFGGVITAGALEDFPPGTVTPVTKGQCYVVRREDGGLLAFYRRCTHLACTVLWDNTQEYFICPCHGSEFEKTDGAVLNPPASRPLMRFPVTLEAGTVTVDTGRLIKSDRVGPDDVVYPPEKAT
jgi:cytochrome b6-f complex iron-sulfur subunit